MHQSESIINIIQGHSMCYERVDLNLPIHIPIYYFWHIRAASRAAERGTFPRSARDQLKWTSCNFLTRPRDADDIGFSPTFVTTL